MKTEKGCASPDFSNDAVRTSPHPTVLGDLEEELKSLLGVNVDFLTPGDLPSKFRAKVLAEAQPV